MRSASVRFCRTRGCGLSGTNCAATSPLRHLERGTAVSWTGNRCLPVSRSSTNVKPIFVSCTTASLPIRQTRWSGRMRRRRMFVGADVVTLDSRMPTSADRVIASSAGAPCLADRCLPLAEAAVQSVRWPEPFSGGLAAPLIEMVTPPPGVVAHNHSLPWTTSTCRTTQPVLAFGNTHLEDLHFGAQPVTVS